MKFNLKKLQFLFFPLVSLFGIITPAKSQNNIHVIKIEDAITPAISAYIKSEIEIAEDSYAECLVIELDTPGGLLESTRSIIKSIFESRVPVIIYVSPSGSRAGSAGVFITMAAHIAVMAPGTNIGAAHPVNLGGQAVADSSNPMNDKILNDTVAFIKTIAEKRERNKKWAESAVRESVSITENEALELNVIDYIAPSLDSLLTIIDGAEVEIESDSVTLNTKNVKIVYREMGWRLKFLSVLANPNIAYILMLLGIYGLFFELYNPGSLVPGIIGGICIILAFFAMQTLPVNYAGLALIFFSIILFLLEIKVQSFGMLTIGGVISFTIGSIMLFKSPIFSISLSVIVSAVTVTALFFIVAISLGLAAQRRKPATGREGLIGETGTAESDFEKDGSGNVLVMGELWKAKSREDLKKGDRVRVILVENMVLEVEKIN